MQGLTVRVAGLTGRYRMFSGLGAHRVVLFGVLNQQLDVGRQLAEVIILVRVQVHLDLGEVDRVLNRLWSDSQFSELAGTDGGEGLQRWANPPRQSAIRDLRDGQIVTWQHHAP